MMRLFGYVITKCIQISLYMNEKVTYLIDFWNSMTKNPTLIVFVRQYFGAYEGVFSCNVQ